MSNYVYPNHLQIIANTGQRILPRPQPRPSQKTIKLTKNNMNLTSIEQLRTLRAKQRRPRRKIPLDKHHEIAHKHLVDGLSLRQLASEYGASHEAIRNIIDKI